MKTWREDRLSALLHIESEIDLFDEVAALAKEIGFEYCVYGIQMPVPISRPTVILFNNYSKNWADRYEINEDGEIDRMVQNCLKSTLPIAWSDEFFESVPELGEQARAYGLQCGWAQVARDASGAVGLLALAGSADQLPEIKRRNKQASHVLWLTQYAHAAMARLLIPKFVPETLVVMTTREKEVLRWTAEGKTASEIGQILLVSERTVNFHINNVLIKLGASNKTQAAVKAAALGMLF